MIDKHKTQSGFTLIEMILYVALVAIFINSAIVFAWNVIGGGSKSAVEREVNQNLRLGAKRIAYEIRNAAGVISVSAEELCLLSADPARSPTKIYSSGGRLRIGWGGGGANCIGVMTNDEPLTGNLITLSSLVFADRSSGTASTNIDFSLTISATGDRQEWQKTGSLSGTAELRSN